MEDGVYDIPDVKREGATQPQPWNGQDLPPIGMVCDTSWNSADHSYVQCKILAHDEDRAVFRFTTGKRKGEYSSATKDDCNGILGPTPQFRPIRTPEQIAADERWLIINMIVDDIVSRYQYPKESERLIPLATALYDAGCSKP